MCGQSSPAACREAAHEWVICIRGVTRPAEWVKGPARVGITASRPPWGSLVNSRPMSRLSYWRLAISVAGGLRSGVGWQRWRCSRVAGSAFDCGHRGEDEILAPGAADDLDGDR